MLIFAANIASIARGAAPNSCASPTCASSDLARQIISEASHLWNGGAALDAMLVTGGGALLLGDHIRQHWPHAQVVTEPVYGNAIGYWKLARRIGRQ